MMWSCEVYGHRKEEGAHVLLEESVKRESKEEQEVLLAQYILCVFGMLIS